MPNCPLVPQWALSNLLYNAFMKRRNLLRIRPKPQRAHTEHIPASFTMAQPAVDDAKRYLAGLHEEEAGKESQLNHSLSFDFTIAEWKSRTQLHQTAPAKALLTRKEILLYDETPEIIPVTLPEPILSPQPISPVLQETPSSVKRRNKLFFNFNKTQHSKTKTLSPASQEATPKKCIKPTLYTLSEQVNTPSRSRIRPIRLNLTPKIQDENPLQFRVTKTKSQLWPLHGIHQHRNKFQLLLNSRKQKAAKILQASAIKPHIVINIFSRRLD